jgi:tetratricopeptide (TPR) repeat protein
MAKDTTGNEIGKLMDQEKWGEARALLQRELRKHPHHHWLLDRLSETYYEEGKLFLARRAIERAHELNPDCPLVLWDYAGTLEEVGQPERALSLYQKLLDKGTEETAYGECGEGPDWAESLLADTAYRAALCCLHLNKPSEAWLHLLKHWSMRDQGASSIYLESEVKELLNRLSRQVGSTSSVNIPVISLQCSPRAEVIRT